MGRAGLWFSICEKWALAKRNKREAVKERGRGHAG